MAVPYKSTPQFDEQSLPDAIRNAHSTKAGVWGLLVVDEGAARLIFHKPRREIAVAPDKLGLIPPQAVHHVETFGPVRLHVEFYRENPLDRADQS
ncbi:DUF1971 domain-containing protein [Croceicoccus sp. Ery15]|uniref:DUF1971 domain-containing protein n=1 Tax=Croceicoccus sp. Ery15 TaxID=1703338 RepID=UPI001E3D3ACD|nr:DUF1971 domain-containing protein [Croceicoccus sp. Ery15]